MGFTPVSSNMLRLELGFYVIHVSKVSFDLCHHQSPLVTHLRFCFSKSVCNQTPSVSIRGTSPLPLGAKEVRQQDVGG